VQRQSSVLQFEDTQKINQAGEKKKSSSIMCSDLISEEKRKDG
jgi:hypothetical protein